MRQGQLGPRATRTRLLFAALILCLSIQLSGCYSPHFDEGLSFSAAFVKELDPVLALGPFGIDNSSHKDGYFLPDRVFAPVDGYWIQDGDYRVSARYVSGLGPGNEYSVAPNNLGSAAVVRPITAMMATGIALAVRGLAVIDANDFIGGVRAYGLDASNNFVGNIDFASSINTFLTAPYYLLGADYGTPSTNTSIDFVSLLFASDAGGYQLSALYIPTSNAAALSLGAETGDLALYDGPHLEPGAFFAYNYPTDRYYLSGRRSSDGSVYTAYWSSSVSGAYQVALPEVDSKLVAILSTGELLALDGTEMVLYDLDGHYETNLHTGSLRFVYEYFDGTDWYCYFTRSIRVKNRDGDKVSIDVWRCPTTELRSLGRP